MDDYGYTICFPADMEFKKIPELPAIQILKGKTKYEVTDMRYLNERALVALKASIYAACTVPDCEGFFLAEPDKDRLEIISDILFGIEWRVKKNKHTIIARGSFLIDGIAPFDNGIKLIFSKRDVRYLREYFQLINNDKDRINLFEAVVYTAEKKLEETICPTT